MKNARSDLDLWFLTGAQTLGALPLLFRKWRRFSRRHDSFEWDLAHWNGDWLQPPPLSWTEKNGPNYASPGRFATVRRRAKATLCRATQRNARGARAWHEILVALLEWLEAS